MSNVSFDREPVISDEYSREPDDQPDIMDVVQYDQVWYVLNDGMEFAGPFDTKGEAEMVAYQPEARWGR